VVLLDGIGVLLAGIAIVPDWFACAAGFGSWRVVHCICDWIVMDSGWVVIIDFLMDCFVVSTCWWLWIARPCGAGGLAAPAGADWIDLTDKGGMTRETEGVKQKDRR
jgi:hypothetical protein